MTTRTSFAVKRPITTYVDAELIAEYDRRCGRLRIADEQDRTVVVYSDGAVYKVAPAAPAGHVVLTETQEYGSLVNKLFAAKVIEWPTEHWRDRVDGTEIAVAKVLI